MSHNPNPFDFVPFAKEELVLKTPEQWLAFGNLKTGRITVQMKALTPVHIVGEQPMETINGKNGKNIEKSLFYQRNGKYYIPGSSIRGALRGFIEAACNGWASQLTPYYEKKEKTHAIGFKVVESETDKSIDIDRELPSAINQKFTIPASADQGIDLASFLFGYIPGKSDNKDQFNTACKSRIMIDDAAFDSAMLSSTSTNDSYRIPDLNNNNTKPNDKNKDPRAFMGGPHPSASSWWYQLPKEIRKDKYGAYKFIGSGFRGRKFYFHQDPVKCVKYYNESSDWNKTVNGIKKLHLFPIECITQGSLVTFNILFNNIPEQLLYILIFALEPGRKIRHKIGYGKAYGYGSIEFSIQEIVYACKGFEDTEDADLNTMRAILGKQLSRFDSKDHASVAHFLHRKSLDGLSLILWYESSFKHIFSYPCAGKGGFYIDLDTQQRKEHNGELKAAIEKTLELNGINVPRNNSVISIDPAKAEKMTRNPFLVMYKPALHFEVYQENSELEKDIKQKRRFKYD